MSERRERRGLDPKRAAHITVVGKKGSGKTELAHALFRSYPYDKLLIDPNGDMKVDGEAIRLPDPPPAMWPRAAQLDALLGEVAGRRRYHELYYVPDYGDPGYAENIDRALGLAFAKPGRKAVMVDEAHDAFPAAQMVKRPHARRTLRHLRHATELLIAATPRTMTVDPLLISQADWVYVFNLPGPADRRRVADNIGWTPKEFDEAVFALGEHEYLRYEAAAAGGQGELSHFPPLPEHLIRHHRD